MCVNVSAKQWEETRQANSFKNDSWAAEWSDRKMKGWVHSETVRDIR